jgi:hypothetical protein
VPIGCRFDKSFDYAIGVSLRRAGVHHQAQMNVMSKLYGGRDNWRFSEREMRNRFDQLHTLTLFLVLFFVCKVPIVT